MKFAQPLHFSWIVFLSDLEGHISSLLFNLIDVFGRHIFDVESDVVTRLSELEGFVMHLNLNRPDFGGQLLRTADRR